MKYTYDYPRPAVTTDCVVFGYDPKGGLSVLLVERGLEPFKGCWAFPGGFMNMDETAEECVIRELQEETGLSIFTDEMQEHNDGNYISDAPVVSKKHSGFVAQLGCFSDVNRDPRGRVVTIAFFTLVQKSEVRGHDDAHEAKWFPINDIPSLAFDHEIILRKALKSLKERIHFKPVGFDLLPEVFTLPQLQTLYESILEVHFDRRNFASKILKLGLVEQAAPHKEGSRTAVLYRFNKDKYREMKSKSFKLEF